MLSPLSDAEAALVSRLNEANDQLVLHRSRVARVDYADFELQGDYAGFCRRRHAPFWGGGAETEPDRAPPPYAGEGHSTQCGEDGWYGSVGE